MTKLILAAALAASMAAPALAQSADGDSWTGFYVGGRAGWQFQPGDGEETINFDNNLDGQFGDVVRTGAGADAFSPGFCGGAARGVTPASGCRKDQDSLEWAVHAGFDYDLGNKVVLGVVGEFGEAKAEDSVSAFSTTPAFYTLTRRTKYTASVRARAGYAFGTGSNTLVYATGGPAWGYRLNEVRSSNTRNLFLTNGADDIWGYRVGGGVEQRVNRHLTIGVQYLYTSLKDNDARVRVAQGSQPATNPFILVNANGTDFARAHRRFVSSNASVTASIRF